MSIEFRCPQCQKLLRVPDESAGAKAKCPQCGSIAAVPSPGTTGSDWEDDPLGSPLGDSADPFAPNIQSAYNPTGGGSVNPYSSPASDYGPVRSKPVMTGQIVPTAVDVGSVINYAWEIWKANLGLLVGITVIVFVVNFGFGAVQGVVSAVFEQQGNQDAGAIIGGLISFIGNFVQIYLGIGQAQIVLKLLRGQRAEFGELFGAGALFLPVLGASILAGFALVVGFVACIVPGVILMLFFWPFYWLIVDRKAGAIESFGMAMPIGKANVGTAFVMWLASFGIMLAGFLALCVGLLFAAPLVSLIWGSGYLMMSGQIAERR